MESLVTNGFRSGKVHGDAKGINEVELWKAFKILGVVHISEITWKKISKESEFDREEFTEFRCSRLNGEQMRDKSSRIRSWFEILVVQVCSKTFCGRICARKIHACPNRMIV